MYKIAIIDDDTAFANNIKFFLESTYSDYEYVIIQCLDYFTPEYCAVFLDIELDGMRKNGFEFANEISKYNIPVIFMTSHKNYIIDGYLYHPFGMFWKIQMYEKLPFITKQLHEYINQQSLRIEVQDENKLIIEVKLTSIIYMYKEGNYVHIKGKESYDKRCSIAQMDQILKEMGISYFISPMHGYLVNCKQIKKVDKVNHKLLMSDNSLVPISARRITEFLMLRAKILRYENG